ncbi:MAG: ATP-binding cassette domain-containing protein [Candidatus Competibacteraceae bacterium]|nr:ATP-binding cassette domain-containing protein [Candidatus Competibacteraceae bacterium]
MSLVGASGAGKTTIAMLLCGLHEPSHGTVEVGGYDMRDIDLTSLRRTVGFVGDANEIFEGTIEDNITPRSLLRHPSGCALVPRCGSVQR